MMEDSGLGLRFGTSGAIAALTASADHERIETEEAEQEDWEEEEEEELPVISIELERLVGFKPSTTEEIESIEKQLLQAMWMRYKSTLGDKAATNKEEDETIVEPPPDFDDQIQELLNSRVARFGSAYASSDNVESTNDNNDKTFLEITYPSQLKASNQNDLKDTTKLWSDIRGLAYAVDDQDDEGGKHEFWYKLSEHLEYTGRSIHWKHGMALELRDMLYRETLHKNHELWNKEQRQAKLEQLYQVRETLVHRKEVAQENLNQLLSVKETAIRRDMLLYDNAVKRQNKTGSLFGSSELSFPEEFELMGLMPKDSQLYEEEDWGGTLDDDDDFEYYQSDYSDYSDLSDDNDDDLSGYEEGEQEDPNVAAESDNEDAVKPVTTLPPDANLATTNVPRPFLRRNKARRKKKARAQKKRELAEAKRKEEAEKRKSHQQLLEAQHTTQELVLAQTLQLALEKKVQDVEELLENLQDEEWAAEEEEEESETQPSKQQPEQAEDGMSLLDQILAMILGALPMTFSRDKEQHFKYIKEEHEFIVRGWKDYFGRLPVPHVAAAEEVQDEDDKEPPTVQSRVGWKVPANPHKLTTISKPLSATTTTSAAASLNPREQRMALGIVDNEGDWEDENDE